MQREIAESAYHYQREVEEGKRIIVGVNRFLGPAEERGNLLRVAPGIQERQRERLALLRQNRDNIRIKGSLDHLREDAQGDGNLVSPILECVEAQATLGEISDLLREVFGEYETTWGL
jgi:methylmalonyl-CoA mutase N-terminal domain/subunit